MTARNEWQGGNPGQGTTDLEGITRGPDCTCRWGLYLGAQDGTRCPRPPDGMCGYCTDHARLVIWWAESIREEKAA